MMQFAKTVWLVLVACGLLAYVLGAFIYLGDFDKTCTETLIECHKSQLATPEDIARLQADGLTMQEWAVLNVGFRSAITFVFCLVAFLIFARKQNEWTGLLFSFFLISFGLIGGNYPSLVANYPAFQPLVKLLAFLGYVTL